VPHPTEADTSGLVSIKSDRHEFNTRNKLTTSFLSEALKYLWVPAYGQEFSITIWECAFTSHSSLYFLCKNIKGHKNADLFHMLLKTVFAWILDLILII